MKILSHVIEGNTLRIMTDNPDRPEFVYKKGKFDNKKQLKREILKSIGKEHGRKKRKKDRHDKLESELNA